MNGATRPIQQAQREDLACSCGTTRPVFSVVPNTAGNIPAPECDLVLKGGLASGIVYARAIPLLAEKYTFRSIGGASAGAAGAVFTAACEYTRASAGTDIAFTEFAAVGTRFRDDPRQLTAVFRPVSVPRRAVFAALFHRYVRYVVVIAWLATPVLTIVFHRRIKTAALILTQWAGPIFLLTLLALAIVLRVLPLVTPMENWPVRWLGLNSGTRRSRACERRATKHHEGRKPRLPLTDWMHHEVQSAVNRSCDGAPLTFAELATVSPDRPIVLRIVVTDLTLRRRVVFPARVDTPAYYYDPDELKHLFPWGIMQHLNRHSPEASEMEVVIRSPGKRRRTRRLRPLPTGQLPIVLAARASAGFPGLFCPIPLWTVEQSNAQIDDLDDEKYQGQTIGIRHLLIDGGASQNFPVSMFDSWVPGRPTFGVRPLRDRGLRLGRRDTGAIASYVSSLFDALVNGHDEVQAVLPGYRERNIDITLRRGLGEMNFWPNRDDIQEMLDVTQSAHETFFRKGGWDWDAHRRRRFDLVLEQLESRVRGGPGTTLETVMRTALRRELEISRDPDDQQKAAAVDQLITVIDDWAPQAEPLFTCREDPPQARGVLRIAPE